MIRFLLLLIVLAGGSAAYAWYDFQKYLSEPIVIPDEHQQFTIEQGWSARRLSSELAEKGIIDKRHWFDLHVRMSQQANKIKTGEFLLPSPISVPELFNTFVEGQTVQYRVSLIEGSNWRQVVERLANSPDIKQTLDPGTWQRPEDLMAALGYEDLHPEGQFFADTYAFPKGTSDIEYLQRAKKTMDDILQEEWDKRVEGLPLQSPYEALILASIVEKETAVAAERPLIAGVFLSRLNKKMRLQTDPTVIYGIGENFDGNIRRSDLTTDTPYNTYTRFGLPPTPIAMVGREAIHAVLNPAETTALYFVAKSDGSGTHQFSETLEQHNAAVRKYQLRR